MAGPIYDSWNNAQTLSRINDIRENFQRDIREELARQIVEDAVEKFRAEITPIVMDKANDLTVEFIQGYLSPLSMEPNVQVAFKL